MIGTSSMALPDDDTLLLVTWRAAGGPYGRVLAGRSDIPGREIEAHLRTFADCIGVPVQIVERHDGVPGSELAGLESELRRKIPPFARRGFGVVPV